jgi:hypothetical protein
MSVSAPFTPMGNSVTFTANVAAPAAVQAVSITPGANQYRIINSGNVTIFLGVGNSAANANNAAVVIANTQPSLALLPGTDEILSFQPNAFFTGITVSGTGAVYITPGDGS